MQSLNSSDSGMQFFPTLKSATLPPCAFATLLCHLCLFDVQNYTLATLCCATLPTWDVASLPCHHLVVPLVLRQNRNCNWLTVQAGQLNVLQ